MDQIKFSVVPSNRDPWKVCKWKPVADVVKSGSIIYVPLFPKGYADTCSQVHNALEVHGVAVTTKKNGKGIYVKAKK